MHVSGVISWFRKTGVYPVAVFSLRKFYTEQMFALLRKKRMQLRNHADTQTVKRSQHWKGYAIYIYIYRIVGSAREWDSTVQIVWWQLRTIEGTLPPGKRWSSWDLSLRLILAYSSVLNSVHVMMVCFVFSSLVNAQLSSKEQRTTKYWCYSRTKNFFVIVSFESFHGQVP